MATKALSVLNRFLKALPERQRHMRERSPDIEAEHTVFRVDPAEPLAPSLPTLDPKVSRPLSPQLRDRFTVAGLIVEASWEYLTPTTIEKAAKSARCKEILKSHREYWDDSAPMQFKNSQLSIFATINDLNDGDVIYFVWPDEENKEPEIWQYSGQSTTHYTDLTAYFEAVLTWNGRLHRRRCDERRRQHHS